MHRVRALLRQVHVVVVRADVVGVAEDDHGLFFATKRLGDLVELRHGPGLQVPFSRREKYLSLQRDHHPAIVVLDGSDLGVRVARVFELRTYHTPEGKLDALYSRFKNHRNRYFTSRISRCVWQRRQAWRGRAH